MPEIYLSVPYKYIYTVGKFYDEGDDEEVLEDIESIKR